MLVYGAGDPPVRGLPSFRYSSPIPFPLSC
jgi:hypothetical protein